MGRGSEEGGVVVGEVFYWNFRKIGEEVCVQEKVVKRGGADVKGVEREVEVNVFAAAMVHVPPSLRR